MKTFVVGAALGALAVFLTPVGAQADTESCASRGEYDNLVRGLTVNQVYNRFDIYGYYMDDTEQYFRRGYKTCWAPGERKIVIEFSYNSGETIDWYVRDV